MLKIPARNFLRYTPTQLWDNLEGDFIVSFPDGDVVSHERAVIYSSYVWEYFRRYPDTPLLKKHFSDVMIGEKELSAGAHLKLINEVLWSVYDTYCGRTNDAQQLLDDLARLAYEITNFMYNELTQRCEPWVTSLDITDFTDFTLDPRLDRAMVEMPPTPAGINAIYKLILDMAYKGPDFKRNPLAVALRTGIAKEGQALQCLGPRGFVTDMDSHQFPYPISTGFVQGIRLLHDSMIESRSAALSLANSTKPLQDSEYFSRRQQLICMNVKNMHPGDCGSQHYLLWQVRDVRYEGTTKVGDGDLRTIQGKFYLDEESNTLKVVRESDKHLIGKTIKMRDPVAGCQHPDPYGVCATCYGETSHAIPKKSNLGHIACVTMTALIGQLILSTKHHLGSSTVEGIVLKLMEKKYLDADINGNSYYLSEKLKGRDVKVYVPVEQARGLTDLKIVKNVTELNISRVSEFSSIIMTVTDKKGSELVPLDVKVNARNSSMTHQFLEHVRRTGCPITQGGSGANGNIPADYYEIDMAGWDYKLPMFVLPMAHFNMSDHQGEIAKMLEATANQAEARSSVVDPKAMLMDFHDLVNRRLNVNLASLSIILYSSMVVSAIENNYDLPKPWTKSGVGVMRLLLSNRSLSAQMGYQNHHNVFADPSSYVEKKRLDHIFDAVLMPEILNNPQLKYAATH